MPSSTPESGIRFFRSGGHNHDGVSSSLIDFSKYSIFDFGTDVTTSNQDNARELSRTNNRNRFDQYIANFISTQILAPAGIVLLENSVQGRHIGADEITAIQIAANTITASEIAAGTITADKLAINVVQVGDTISSTGYVLGTTGWQIRSNGSAEFNNNIVVRGQIEASSGNFSGNINAGGTFANGSISNGAITGGSISINGGVFSVASNGLLTATNAIITGNITAGSASTISGNAVTGGTISGTSLSIGSANTIFKVASNGAHWSGNANFGSAPFAVTAGGTMTAQAGSIGGWTIATDSISGTNATLYSNGYINATGANFVNTAITSGAAGAGFGVTTAGVVAIVNGALAGYSLSTSGMTFGNVSLAGSLIVGDGLTGSGAYTTQITGGSVNFKKGGVLRGTIYGETYLTSSTIFYNSDIAQYNASTFIFGSGTASFLGTPTSSAFAGTVMHAASGLIYKYTSRREFKKDITPIINGIEKIKLLNPVNYKLRYNQNDSELRKYLMECHTQYGFIVEDILEVDRDLVIFDYYDDDPAIQEYDFSDENNFTATMYDVNGVISILTASVKELIAKVESLEARIGE
jgi:hypothetical protein